MAGVLFLVRCIESPSVCHRKQVYRENGESSEPSSSPRNLLQRVYGAEHHPEIISRDGVEKRFAIAIPVVPHPERSKQRQKCMAGPRYMFLQCYSRVIYYVPAGTSSHRALQVHYGGRHLENGPGRPRVAFHNGSRMAGHR